MNWLKIERILGEDIPECIKKILSCSGYDTMLSLKNINLERIEKHINEHCRDLIQGLDCCHHEFYQKQEVFRFLPGHGDFLSTLSNYMCNHIEAEAASKTEVRSGRTSDNLRLAEMVKQMSGFSVILKELILTAIKNADSSKNNAEYSDIIRYFATYVYIIGGRSCYEILHQNLPLPSRSTICKTTILFILLHPL